MENNFIDTVIGENIITDSINSTSNSLKSSVSSTETTCNKSIINNEENYNDDQKKEILEIINLSDDDEISSDTIKTEFEIEDINKNQIKKIDKNIAFLIFILGMGNILPFQTFLASLDYLDNIFPQYKMASTFPCIYMVVICVTFIVLLRFQNKFKSHIILSIGFPCYIVLMILTPIVTIVSHTPITTYLVILLLMALCSFVDGLSQGTIYAYASKFGPRYSTIAVTGNGVAGVFVVLTRLICKLSFSSDNNSKKIGLIVYFIISAIIILIAITTFFYSLKIERIRKILITNNNNNNNKNQIENDNQVNNINGKEKHPFKEVFKKTYGFGFMVFYNFVIVLFLFPGIVVRIESLHGIKSDWWVFIIIAVYNTSDCIGKTLFSIFNYIILPLKLVWVVLIGKSIFVLLFFLCIYNDNFNHEQMVIIFLIIFGVLSGGVVSYGVSEGPKRVEEKYKPSCSVFLSLALNIGLMSGSSLNLLVSFFM
ncbi:equilibrative nucleoside transporter family protein [Dictyostelium discoideum AX4]|uniref:Equilibrative nucleoside transporter family protein n=1 Tax=Dictyostelium discoideum TaxID=44689 RepID=Q54TT3_DICDI|nr:equilibrative nucleoside transporter family protein [Dictyostelium discoideum AX4]EAL66738.1 equilibrative nucleoside transporter family protein [Dictyostelium discoideum AX4]|eukprot:XP_640728.1 equilibrative nucleoside transporter family protein [Dictyostelium discoideum AX4]